MNPSHICPALLCGLSSRPSCGFLFSYFPVRHGASKSSDMGGALVWFHGRGISLSCKILKALSTKRRDGDSTFVGKINDAASPRHRHEASLLRSLNNLLRADRLEVVLRLPPSLSLFPRSLIPYDSTPDWEQIPCGRRNRVDRRCGLQTERGGREQMTGKHLNRHRKAETPRARRQGYVCRPVLQDPKASRPTI